MGVGSKGDPRLASDISVLMGTIAVPDSDRVSGCIRATTKPILGKAE